MAVRVRSLRQFRRRQQRSVYARHPRIVAAIGDVAVFGAAGTRRAVGSWGLLGRPASGYVSSSDRALILPARITRFSPVGEHFHAGMDYQDKLARFLENHDETRAAAAFPLGVREAAAVITFLSPGLRFLRQGQFEGRKKRILPHFCRGPIEPVDQGPEQFYVRLLAVLRQPVARDGRWQLLDCIPAWDGNWTHDCFLAFAWQGSGAERLLVAVNYALNHGQCRV